MRSFYSMPCGKYENLFFVGFYYAASVNQPPTHRLSACNINYAGASIGAAAVDDENLTTIGNSSS